MKAVKTIAIVKLFRHKATEKYMFTAERAEVRVERNEKVLLKVNQLQSLYTSL